MIDLVPGRKQSYGLIDCGSLSIKKIKVAKAYRYIIFGEESYLEKLVCDLSFLPIAITVQKVRKFARPHKTNISEECKTLRGAYVKLSSAKHL